jgi:DNA ligase (NAD+)
LAQFTHFVSRKAMNIEGLSEATLEKFIKLGWLNQFIDIYHLSDHRIPMIKLDGFGKKSVDKLLGAIEKSRTVKLESFIAALGIPNIGLSAAKTISKHFHGNYEEFIDAYFYWRFDWTKLDDFGNVMADSINNYLHDNLEAINDLAAEINFIEQEEKVVAENPFTGKSICVTGKLDHFTRDSINNKIASIGAKTASSVSKKTDYLLTNEVSGSSKYKKAVELGIPIITEEEFLQLIGE